MTIQCPSCRASLQVVAGVAPERVRCGRCGREIALLFSEAVRHDRRVDVCPLCQGPDFYRRKDFHPTLGLIVVIIGALISAGLYWYGLDLAAYGVLALAVAIDFVTYQWLGEVTVCYRCQTEFRGAYRRTASAFDLHRADLLEHEYRRRIGGR